MNGPEIERLIQLLGRLPGLGPRSARRVALHLLKKRETLMQRHPPRRARAEPGQPAQQLDEPLDFGAVHDE